MPHVRHSLTPALKVAGLALFAMFAVICVLLAYNVMSAGAKSKALGEVRAQTAKSTCKTLYLIPCIGPIDTLYDMDGLGGGNTKLLWATRPSKGTIENVPNGNLEKQAFVCHTVPSVKIVAVFIARSWEPTRGHVRKVNIRVPTGSHSCKVTLSWVRELRPHPTSPNANPPNLVLEGKRVG